MSCGSPMLSRILAAGTRLRIVFIRDNTPDASLANDQVGPPLRGKHFDRGLVELLQSINQDLCDKT